MEVLATRRFFNKSGNITPRLLISLYTLRSSFQSDSRARSLQKQARQDCKKEWARLNTKTSSSRMERGTSREKTGPPFISYFDCGNVQKKRLLSSFFKVEVAALQRCCWIFFVCGIFHVFWKCYLVSEYWKIIKRRKLSHWREMKIYSEKLFYVPASAFRVEQNPMKRKRKQLRVFLLGLTPLFLAARRFAARVLRFRLQ